MQGNTSKSRYPRLCLLVDGSATARRVAGGMLRDLGFIVAEAINGKQALEVCRGFIPDVVLLDWNVLKTDGVTCLLHLHEMTAPRHSKIILCTTENSLDKISTAMAVGADDYIMKPFHRNILREKIVQLGLDGAVKEAA